MWGQQGHGDGGTWRQTWGQWGHGDSRDMDTDMGTAGTWGQQGQQSPTPPAGAPSTPQHPSLHPEGWGLRGGAERDPHPYRSPQPQFVGQLRPSRAPPGGLAGGHELRPAPVCSLRGQACGEHPWVAASPGPFSGAQRGHETSPGPSCSSARHPGRAPRPAASQQETPSPCPWHAGFNTFPPRWRLSPFLQAEPVAWQRDCAQRHGLRPPSPLPTPFASPWGPRWWPPAVPRVLEVAAGTRCPSRAPWPPAFPFPRCLSRHKRS